MAAAFAVQHRHCVANPTVGIRWLRERTTSRTAYWAPLSMGVLGDAALRTRLPMQWSREQMVCLRDEAGALLRAGRRDDALDKLRDRAWLLGQWGPRPPLPPSALPQRQWWPSWVLSLCGFLTRRERRPTAVQVLHMDAVRGALCFLDVDDIRAAAAVCSAWCAAAGVTLGFEVPLREAVHHVAGRGAIGAVAWVGMTLQVADDFGEELWDAFDDAVELSNVDDVHWASYLILKVAEWNHTWHNATLAVRDAWEDMAYELRDDVQERRSTLLGALHGLSLHSARAICSPQPAPPLRKRGRDSAPGEGPAAKRPRGDGGTGP